MGKHTGKNCARWKQVLMATLAFKSTFTFNQLLREVYVQWPGNWKLEDFEAPDSHRLHVAIYCARGLKRTGLIARFNANRWTLTLKGYAVRHDIAERYRTGNVYNEGRSSNGTQS